MTVVYGTCANGMQLFTNNVTLRETLLNMACIYCGGTADDVPLFCVDVESVKSCSRRNTSHHRYIFLYGSW